MTQLAFLHIRVYDLNGGIAPTGGLTTAIQAVDGNLVYAVARCSDADVFCKKTGRDIATGRLAAYLAGKQVQMVYTIPDAGTGRKHQVSEDLANRGMTAYDNSWQATDETQIALDQDTWLKAMKVSAP
jgi:hypothetical protein